MTSEPFARESIAGQLTFFAEDFPVKIFPLPEKAKDSPERKAVYGAKCDVLSTPHDRAFALLRMSLQSELAALTGYSPTWKRSVTPQNRSWWVLAISAQRTLDRESGSLRYVRGKTRNWATLRAQEPEKVNRSRSGGNPVALTPQVKAWGSLLHAEISEAGRLLQLWTPPSCPVLNVKFAEWLMGYPIGWTDLREVTDAPVSLR
jgi:hypothetical protein